MSELSQYDFRNKIANVAAELFTSYGYHGTSVADVALLVDVDQHVLLSYFPHKLDLFGEALKFVLCEFEHYGRAVDEILVGSKPEIVIPEILNRLSDGFTREPRLLPMVSIAYFELRGEARETCIEYLGSFLSRIRQYFDTNIKAGDLRDVDSVVTTGALVVMALASSELSKVIQDAEPLGLDRRGRLQICASVLLNILVPSRTYQEDSSSTAPSVGA